MQVNTEDLVRRGIQLRKEIEETINQGNYETARIILNRNIKNYEYDIEWCMLKAALEFADGDYQSAKNILLEKYPQHEWNFDVNYNLGLFCYHSNAYKAAIQYFMRCLLHEQLTDTLLKDISDMIEEMCKIDHGVLEYFRFYKRQEEQFKNRVYSSFPDKCEIIDDNTIKKNFIGEKFEINNKDYYCGVNDRYFEERDGISLYGPNAWRGLYKTEVLKGKQVLNFNFCTEEKTVFALMPLKSGQRIFIEANDVKLDLNKLLANRYYYYTFEKGSKLEIKSEEHFVVSEPILLTYNKKKPKVIINLFIDGLSQKYLDDIGLENLMPNTYSFFKEGTICKNAYANSEWTHPSLANTFTGKYTLGKAGHRIFHPIYSSENLREMELFPEIIGQNGYLCTKIDGEWRSTPNSGYAKGMDRILYQPSVRSMFGDEAIMDAIEHLEAFKECNNFVWVSLPDLHDVADEFESTISTQIKTSLKHRNIKHTQGTSVRKRFDETKAIRFEAQLKRIDTLLDIIYSYIKRNYKEDEYVVSLMADHGQGYLIPESGEFLEEYRNKIAMMYRGHNIPKGYCEEFIESVDLFPTLFHCSGINDFDCKEGNIPEWFGGIKKREYSFSESVFPGSPYHAVINDNKYKFFFSTIKECSNDGYLDATDYTVKLVEKGLEEDVTQENQEIVNRYTDIVFNHIKEYVKSI